MGKQRGILGGGAGRRGGLGEGGGGWVGRRGPGREGGPLNEESRHTRHQRINRAVKKMTM